MLFIINRESESYRQKVLRNKLGRTTENFKIRRIIEYPDTEDEGEGGKE
jgi:hypothetical protein